MFGRLWKWVRGLFAPAKAGADPSPTPLRSLLTRQELLWVQAEASTIDQVVEDTFTVPPAPTGNLDKEVWVQLVSARPRGYRIPDPVFVQVLALDAAARTLGVVVDLPREGAYTLQWNPATGELPRITRQDGAL